jgi:phospholipid-transporting ATPase
MVRVAKARLGGEQASGGGASSSSGFVRRESTARLGGGGTSFRRQPQPMAPTVRTVYCNDREANAPVGYKVRRARSTFRYVWFGRPAGWISVASRVVWLGWSWIVRRDELAGSFLALFV